MKKINLDSKWLVLISVLIICLILINFLWIVLTLNSQYQESQVLFEEHQVFDEYTNSIANIQNGIVNIVHRDINQGYLLSKSAFNEKTLALKKINVTSFAKLQEYLELKILDNNLTVVYEDFLKIIKNTNSFYIEREASKQFELEVKLQVMQNIVDQIQLKNIILQYFLHQHIKELTLARNKMTKMVYVIFVFIFFAVLILISFIYSLKDESELHVSAKNLAETEKEKFDQIADLNRELIVAQGQLVQSAKLASLGEMAAGVAHELNNPLYLIGGFNERVAKVLMKNNPEAYELVKEYIDDIADGAKRMKLIIGDLKDFSRKSSHVMELVSINEVLEKSFALTYKQLLLGNIAIIKNYLNIDYKIKGDSNKLMQVFINLIVNAKDAIESSTRKDGRELRVSTKLEKDFVIIIFQDNGCGMLEETRLKVFDAFFTTKVIGKGTGLGGSISYGIIKEHNGTIECTSAIDIGTTFIIKLPVLKNIGSVYGQ